MDTEQAEALKERLLLEHLAYQEYRVLAEEVLSLREKGLPVPADLEARKENALGKRVDMLFRHFEMGKQ